MSGKNVAGSVRQRLLNLSRKTGEDFQFLLTRYGCIEGRVKNTHSFLLANKVKSS